MASFSPSFLLLLLLTLSVAVGGEDPYRVLGVSHRANTQEIRSAYKRMAKKWHPDKNKSPEAHEKIMQINKAYEVLSDEEKRHHYDITGETEDSPNPTRGHTPFTMYPSGNVFRFHFTSGGHRPRSDDVSTHRFFERIIPESEHKPYLLYFYADFCLQCGQVESIWNQLRNEVESHGVGLGSVHGNLHSRVTHYCGVAVVPSVVGVVSGRVVSYRGGVSVRSIKDFLESLLPSSIITELSPSSFNPFLSQAIIRNRPRVILFSPRTSPSLPYKLAAFTHQNTIDFAFISTDTTNNPGNRPLLGRFGIWTSERKLLTFKEYHEQPALTLDAYQLEGVSLGTMMEGLTLYLPRLSAPRVFDLICPYPSTNRLCVVLPVPDNHAYNDTITAAFRKLARKGLSVRHTSVGFAYLDSAKQAAFVQTLVPIPSGSGNCHSGQDGRPIVVLQRLSSQQIRFDWFVQFCGEDADEEALSEFLSAMSLRKTAHLPPLEDEEAPGWMGRMWLRMVRFAQDIANFVSALDAYASTLGSLLFAALVVCLMGLVGGDQEEEQRPSRSSRSKRPLNMVRISRMNQERYLEIVADSQRGTITLVLMVDGWDNETRTMELKTAFSTAAHRWSPRVKLRYLCYRSHSWWIPELVKHCVHDSSVNDSTAVRLGREAASAWIDACHTGEVVTVLALFGAKRQFCAFPENGILESPKMESNAGPQTKMETSTHKSSVGGILGNTLGFETEDNDANAGSSNVATSRRERLSDLEPRPMTVDETGGESCSTKTRNNSSHRHDTEIEGFTRRFRLWLDRLADGSLKRYQVDVWPEWRD